MSVSVVQTKSNDSNSTSVTTLAATFDSSPAEGNLLRVMLVTQFGAGTLTPPSGWTLEAQDTTAHHCYMYYKIAGAGESSTVTFSWTTARRATIMAREYSGIDTVTPFNVSSSAAGSAKPHSTGTTGTIGAGNTFSEAWFGTQDTSAWTSTRTYTNSYVESASQEDSSAHPAIYVAQNPAVTPGGTTETAIGTASAGGAIWGRLVVLANGPLVPGSASATNRTATTANLSATDASGGTDPYTYQWHRSETQGFTPGGGNAVAGATSLTLTDTGLTDATTYYYVLVYTDDDATAVNSNEVAVTTSGNPLVVITDFNDATTGTYEIMGPGIAVFTIAGSLIGTGEWRHCMVKWDFGDDGSEYNENRGFSGGHFYDVEPVENTDFTVTCTVTNSGGLSSSATRTVRVTPNTRRKVFIDPDIGSATPADPTDSGDPYDTIASCVAGETMTDLEMRLTAAKTHVWGAIVGGSGASNVLVRSTVNGTKFNVTVAGDVILGGDTIALRDANFLVSGLGSPAKILDQRSSTPHRCWVVDCESVDPDVGGLTTTAGSSKQTLMQNVITRNCDSADYWLPGDQIVLHNVQSLNFTGNERPYRCEGNWLTMNQCYGEYQAIDGKSAFTKSGGQWTYIYGCTFEVGADATNGSSTCMKIGHNIDSDVVTCIVERTLFLMKPVLAGSEVSLQIGTTGETAVSGVCIRNCVMAGARTLVSFGTTDVLAGDDIDFFHNTMIVSDTAAHFILQAKYGSTFVANNLLLGYTTKNEVVTIVDSTTNDPLLTNNVAPVATSDDDIRVDGAVSRDDWATFNATALGSGNLSKNISYDSGTYRPTDTTDADLLKTVLAEMGAVPEDYYGTERTGSVWVAGAVGTEAVVDPDPDPEEPGSGGGSVPASVYRFAALRNTLRQRSQNCDDPRLTEAQRLECRRRQRSISRNG